MTGDESISNTFTDIYKLGLYNTVDYQILNSLNPMPVATDEVVANLKTMRDMGAIFIDTIIKKSDLIKDVSDEKTRLHG